MFCFAQASVVFYELHIGFGRTGVLLDITDIEPMEKVGSINQITCYPKCLPDESYNRRFMLVISFTVSLWLSRNYPQPFYFCG